MYETYIASLSEHLENEDTLGRLSMWRAYGDVALVINSNPFIFSDPKLGVFSAPVQYATYDYLRQRFKNISEIINSNREILKTLPLEILLVNIHRIFLLTAISSKHPGFCEEREWRIFYMPSLQESKVLKRDIVVIKGGAQIIYKLPLKNDPENGLILADISSCLDRIIIGPSRYPYVNLVAFMEVLKEEGVSRPEQKVVYSEIPLRK